MKIMNLLRVLFLSIVVITQHAKAVLDIKTISEKRATHHDGINAVEKRLKELARSKRMITEESFFKNMCSATEEQKDLAREIIADLEEHRAEITQQYTEVIDCDDLSRQEKRSFEIAYKKTMQKLEQEITIQKIITGDVWSTKKTALVVVGALATAAGIVYCAPLVYEYLSTKAKDQDKDTVAKNKKAAEDKKAADDKKAAEYKDAQEKKAKEDKEAKEKATKDQQDRLGIRSPIHKKLVEIQNANAKLSPEQRELLKEQEARIKAEEGLRLHRLELAKAEQVRLEKKRLKEEKLEQERKEAIRLEKIREEQRNEENRLVDERHQKHIENLKFRDALEREERRLAEEAYQKNMEALNKLWNSTKDTFVSTLTKAGNGLKSVGSAVYEAIKEPSE